MRVIWRSVPITFWESKADEEGNLRTQLHSLKSQLKTGGEVRSELEDMQKELENRFKAVRMGYNVLLYARGRFLKWLFGKGLLPEHAYQYLEEYAAGARDGLSQYWADEARQKCSEGALVRADWVFDRCAKERAVMGHRPVPQLAVLAPTDPARFSQPLPPIAAVPHRHPSTRFVGISTPSTAELPPPYPTDVHEPQEDDSAPTLSGHKAHPADSGNGDMVDLIDFEEGPSPRSYAAL